MEAYEKTISNEFIGREFGGRVWKPRDPRYKINAMADAILSDGSTFPFKLYDISASGAWLETPYLLEVGEKIWLVVRVPGVPTQITLPAIVVRVSDETPQKPWGIGIKFLLNRVEKERLSRFLELFGY